MLLLMLVFQYARKAERNAKLITANAEISSVSVTSIPRQRTTRFVTSHSPTASSESSTILSYVFNLHEHEVGKSWIINYGFITALYFRACNKKFRQYFHIYFCIISILTEPRLVVNLYSCHTDSLLKEIELFNLVILVFPETCFQNETCTTFKSTDFCTHWTSSISLRLILITSIIISKFICKLVL